MNNFRSYLLALFFSIILMIASGCGNVHLSPSTQDVQCDYEQTDKVDTRVLTIKSDHCCCLKHMQNDVRSRLELAVNGGIYNIISIRTHYLSGYLIAAEITYNRLSRGKGNKMRLIFVSSEKELLSQKAFENKSRLRKIVKNEKYDIIKVNNTYLHGNLLAAEVYFFRKN